MLPLTVLASFSSFYLEVVRTEKLILDIKTFRLPKISYKTSQPCFRFSMFTKHILPVFFFFFFFFLAFMGLLQHNLLVKKEQNYHLLMHSV